MLRVVLAMAAILASYSYAQQPPASVPAQSAPAQVPGPLPLTQVAARGEELSRTLREISQKMPSDADLAAFDQELSRQEKEIRASQAESSAALASGRDHGAVAGTGARMEGLRSARSAPAEDLDRVGRRLRAGLGISEPAAVRMGGDQPGLTVSSRHGRRPKPRPPGVDKYSRP